MLSLVLACSLGLVHLPQTGDVEATIEALIARTNELEGFDATYSIESSEGETGSLRLAYESPGRGRMSLEGAAFGSSFTSWLVDGESCTFFKSDEGSTTYARFIVDQAVPPVYELAHERFPIETEDDQMLGRPVFGWRVGYDPASDEANLELALMVPYYERAATLGWLPAWRDQAELLELTEDRLVLAHERFGGTIALDTGFPIELWLTDKDGAERRFRLESLELEPPAEEGLFDLPDRPAGAEDTSEKVLDGMRGVEVLPMTRQACHRRIDGSLAGGGREWNERTREDAREVFAALHAEWLDEHVRADMETFEGWIESYVQWLEGQRAAGFSDEVLRPLVDRTRAELQESNDAGRASTWESTVAQELPEDDSGHGADLLAIEEAVFAEVFAELAGEPRLAAFDAAVAAVFDR